MEGPIAAPRDVSQALAKDNDSRSRSPPPAYTSLRRMDLRSIVALRQQARPQQPSSLVLDRTPVTSLLAGSAMADDQGEVDEGSPISLRINTSVTVSSDNNLICLADTPASHANAIAHAVVKALQENSSGQCGIPMIDEDGRPRPLKIEVDAGMTIEGSGNVIGNEATVHEIARQRSLTRRRQESGEDASGDEAGPSKRRRPSR